mmetsp:Transcript_22002/g.56372  ORF Transcript_22002/g.56372 Transcript_22002/m.56372 type:complete len:412 (-) Transcript_22002:315-1550(-)
MAAIVAQQYMLSTARTSNRPLLRHPELPRKFLFAAPVVECFALNAEDALLGDVSWLLYRVSHNLDPMNLAGALELLFQRYIDPAELTINGGEKPFGPRTASWRTLARVAAANTNLPRKVINSARMKMAKMVYRGLLGSCLPSQSTVDKQFDGFRSVAVAASIHLDRVVTPFRARQMFHTPGNQSFELTAYGTSVFERCQKAWPPCPENASQFTLDPPSPQPKPRAQPPPVATPPPLVLHPTPPTQQPPASPTWSWDSLEVDDWTRFLEDETQLMAFPDYVASAECEQAAQDQAANQAAELMFSPQAHQLASPPFAADNPLDSGAAYPSRPSKWPRLHSSGSILLEMLQDWMATENPFLNNEPPASRPQEFPATPSPPLPATGYMAGHGLGLLVPNMHAVTQLERQMSGMQC